MKQTLSFFLFQTLPFLVCPNVLFSVPKWGGSKSGLMWRQSYALRKCTGTQRISKSSLEKLGTKRSQTFTRLVRFHPRGRLMKNGFHTWEKTQSKMCSLKSTRIEHSLNSCILFAWKSLLELDNKPWPLLFQLRWWGVLWRAFWIALVHHCPRVRCSNRNASPRFDVEERRST